MAAEVFRTYLSRHEYVALYNPRRQMLLTGVQNAVCPMFKWILERRGTKSAIYEQFSANLVHLSQVLRKRSLTPVVKNIPYRHSMLCPWNTYVNILMILD